MDQSTGSFFLQVVVSQLRSNSESFNDMMTGVAASVSEMIDGEVAQTVNASSSLRCKLVLQVRVLCPSSLQYVLTFAFGTFSLDFCAPVFLCNVQFAVPAPVALPADTEALALLQCLGKSPRPSVADMKFIVKHVQPVLSSLAVAASFSTFVFGLVQTYDETSAANRVTCSEAGVIETVIAAISAHGAISGGFVIFACGTLGNLAKGTPANADKIVEAGGLDVISAMMIAYPTSLSVQLGCCQSVGCLAEASPAAAAIIAQDERVVTLLRAARSNHPSEPAGEGKEAKCNVKWLVTATLRILGVPE